MGAKETRHYDLVRCQILHMEVDKKGTLVGAVTYEGNVGVGT